MRPLEGRRIVVTRPRATADRLMAALAAEGAHPIALPTVEIVATGETGDFERCLTMLERYRWIAFTSTLGVEVFLDRLDRRQARLPPEVRVAAVGPATAASLADYGVTADFVAAEHRGEALAATLPIMAGDRVLCPRSGAGSPVLPELLTRRGATVDDVELYRPVPVAPDPVALGELERGVDAITFTSGSTVENFVSLLGERSTRLARDTLIACLGPVTAAVARRLGFTVAIEPPVATTEGLVAALRDHFAQNPERKSHD